MKIVAATASVLTCIAAAIAVADATPPDTKAAEKAARVRELTKTFRNGFANVRFKLKTLPDGTKPNISSNYRCPGCGSQNMHVSSDFIEKNIPCVVEGFVIAESLDRCNIPCRVMSFCSMTGYTILRIFRDYRERGANDRIFEYVSNGCNRDGLGIRMAHHLMQKQSCDHKILIVLSDAKPNDVVRMRPKESDEFVNYEMQQGIRDTAFEVRSARADGIAVICVFTGDDEDVPSAKLIYGRDFARIQSLDKLADTVGMLLQNQIKNM